MQPMALINMYNINVRNCEENGNIGYACTVIFDNVFMPRYCLGNNKEIFEWNLNKFEILFRWVVDNANCIVLNWHHLSSTLYHFKTLSKQYCEEKHWIDIRYLNVMISYLANNMIDKLKKKIKFNGNEKHSVVFGRIYRRIFCMVLQCTFTNDDFYHVRVENFKDLKQCMVDESHDMHDYGIILKDLIKNVHLLCQNIEKIDGEDSDCNYIQFLKSDEWVNLLTDADAVTAPLIKDIVHTCVFEDCN